MASGPMLAGLFASTAVSKIGQNQGWSPVLTGLLSTVAGAGVGSVGAGISAANAAVPTGAVWNPVTVGRGAVPSAMVSSGPSVAQAAGQAFKNTFADPKFQYAMGAQVIDGLFAEPPRPQSLGGGGGGGGGGSAPAYQGGGGGQYQLIQSFPQRGTSIKWQEVA